MILTIDLGTTVTKVVVWSEDGPVGDGSKLTRFQLHRRQPGRTGPGLVVALGRGGLPRGSVIAGTRTRTRTRTCTRRVAGVNAAADRVFGGVSAIGFAAARQTFVPVDADAYTPGPGSVCGPTDGPAPKLSLWRHVRRVGGADAVRRRTGVVLDGGSVAAKIAWLERHEPERIKPLGGC